MIRPYVLLLFTVLAVFLSAGLASADDAPLPADSILHFQIFGSNPYNYGGGPADVTATSTSGHYTFTSFPAFSDSPAEIFVNTNLAAPSYSVGFDAPADHHLVVGSFTSPSGSGGVYFGEHPPAVSVGSKNWQILEVAYTSNGSLIQLAADFEALGEDGQLLLRGEIRFHSTVLLRGLVTFAADAFQKARSSGSVVVTVARTGNTSAAASVQYRTTPYSAVKNRDYAKTKGTLTWAAGDASSKTFAVPVLPAGDTVGDRVLFASLKGDGVGTIANAAVTIIDDRQRPAALRPVPDGSIDSVYAPLTGDVVPASVGSLAPQADGSVYVGGSFYTVAGRTQPGILKVDAQGVPDFGFQSPLVVGGAQDSGSSSSVRAIAVQPDGKVLVAGEFLLADTGKRALLARLNPDGSLDAGFHAYLNADYSANVYAMALQPDGGVVVAGALDNNRTRAARFHPDGTPDSGFNPPPFQSYSTGRIVRIQPDGCLLVSTEDGEVMRLHADGSVDDSFFTYPFPVGDTNNLVLQPNGKIILANTMASVLIARLNHDGSLDTSFVGFADARAPYSSAPLALQPDGKLLVGARYSPVDGSPVNLLRLNTDGTLDTSFHTAAAVPLTPLVLALDASGGLLVGSAFSYARSETAQPLVTRLMEVDPTLPVVSIASDGSAAVKTSGQPGRLVLTRTGGDLSAPLAVHYSAGGSATAGLDYAALSGRAKFPAGESTVAIEIDPLPDETGRGPHKVKIKVQAAAKYRLGSPSTAKVMVVDAL